MSNYVCTKQSCGSFSSVLRKFNSFSMKVFIFIFFITSQSFATQLKLNLTKDELLKENKKLITSFSSDFRDFTESTYGKNYSSCRKFVSVKKERKVPLTLRVWWSYLSVKCLIGKGRNLESRLLKRTINRHIENIEKHLGVEDLLNEVLAQQLIKLVNQHRYKLNQLEKDFLTNNEDKLNSKSRASYLNKRALDQKMSGNLAEAASLYFQAYKLSGVTMYGTRLMSILKDKSDLMPHYVQFVDEFTALPTKSKSPSVFSKLDAIGKKGQSLNYIKEMVKISENVEKFTNKRVKKAYNILNKRTKAGKINGTYSLWLDKCSANCLAQVSEYFSLRHKHKTALALAKKSIKKKGNVLGYLIAGKTQVFLGEYEDAKKSFNNGLKVSEKFSKYYFDNLFKLGLLHFRLKEYNQVISLFESHKDYKDKNKYNLSMHYWLWRSLQQTKSPKALAVRDKIVQLYPLTYYGLRANYEKNNQAVRFVKGEAQFSKKMSWAPDKRASWNNYLSFLNLGCNRLARLELKGLFSEKDPVETLFYSNYLGLTTDHYKAIRTLNDLWDKDPQLHLNSEVLKINLPMVYAQDIRANASKYKLEPELISGLIKQESSFMPKAKSWSNAMGLMQLVPMTIKDAAKYAKMSRIYARRNIYDPTVNIKLGSSYLRRLIRAFDGHIPLALAAYNAGIGNIRRWMALRPDELKPLTKLHNSEVDNEIWIDELPWTETNHYVKSILRNLVLYRYVYKSNSKFNEPIWYPEPTESRIPADY